MNAPRSTILGLVIAMGGWSCFAQEAAVPSTQLPEAPQLQAQTMPPATVSTSLISYGVPYAVSSAVTVTPVHTDVPPRTIDKKYMLVNGLQLGMMIFDVEMTQHCIADHHCQEGNPLMPSSHAGQLAVGFGFVAYGSGLSYWLKKHKSKQWWIPPVGGAVAHAIGTASGFKNQ